MYGLEYGFLEEMIHRPSHSRQVLFYLVCLAGSLMDWTYQLFITCVLLTGFCAGMFPNATGSCRVPPGVFPWRSLSAYAAVVVFHQETGSVLHHIRVRSGSMISGDGISFPTLLITLDWWNRLLRKLMQYWLTGSPFHPADLAVLVCPNGKDHPFVTLLVCNRFTFVPPIFCYFPMPPITTTGVTFKSSPYSVCRLGCWQSG